MRYLILITAALFLSCATVSAADGERNVAVKLTQTHKPKVRVLTNNERTALLRKTAVFDLSVDPNQIICRTERVGPASRLTTRRCKTREEIRRQLNQNAHSWDNEKFKQKLRTARSGNRARGQLRDAPD